MNKTNNFNFNTTNNLNFLTHEKNTNPIKENEGTITSYHSRNNSTHNRPFKLTNHIISKHTSTPFNPNDNNQYLNHREILKRDQLSKLVNISKTNIKETRYDFIISFEDNALPRPRQNNIKIYNKLDSIIPHIATNNRSSFEYPSVASNSNKSYSVKNNTSILGDYLETNKFPSLETFAKKELRIRDMIKSNIEKKTAINMDINNNLFSSNVSALAC